ncbi:MAG: SUMF1/EgtB/PvdO family nonheme iron enzyme [Candidatus Contendobacter sp.]|nr:SUMF1/EgtB/PvdO family nonheme iron enzyme [Candidatus Contendobacter sp.]MDS4057840.1 SUMF1/EgtB/PvdO family nonheme iron enzyme [Candidatus Contendobacter sp.]
MSRDQVFISYSHKDSKWLERLQIHLTPLQRGGAIKPWADTAIKPGQLWKEEIEKALARAKVAVLLVSPDFLASRFIHENELPPLLEANKKEGLTILWVPVEPCHYAPTVIAQYQAAHDPARPLSDMSRAKRNKALVEIVKNIEAVAPPLSSASSPAPTTPPAMVPAAPALPAIQNIHGWSVSQVQALQRQTAQALKLPTEFRDVLKDGGEGPMMAVIPGGRFLMGSPPDEPERRDNERQHEIEVAPFALGKFTVTFEEYDRFANATNYNKPEGEGWGRGRRPVINVTWLDAMAYAEWLSRQTGQTYRLPTEAEWEYACRAGTTTPFYLGETLSTDQANYDGNYVYGKGRKGIYRQKTVEVGQFSVNAWGLHDMHGNVWEWTGSEYDEGYGGAELRIVSDPNSDGPRVLRGGSWFNGPKWLRSAARDGNDPRSRNFSIGFRLARTLTL